MGGEHGELEKQIEAMRREIRSLHGSGKPWYMRSPFKETIAHALSVTTAVGIGLVVHKWTGAPVVIEAKNVPAASASELVATAALRSAEMVREAVDDAGPSESAPAAAVAVVRATPPKARLTSPPAAPAAGGESLVSRRAAADPIAVLPAVKRAAAAPAAAAAPPPPAAMRLDGVR
jgi:hypothetical protein